MYVFLFISIFTLITLLCYSQDVAASRRRETFVSGETMSHTQPDYLSLEQYCVAKGANFAAYKKSIITNQHTKAITAIMKVYKEKQHINWVREVEPWSISITDASIEHGYAFTVGHTMYIPVTYMEDGISPNLFFHELRHIWQRQNYSRFLRSLDPVVWKGWNFRIVKNLRRAMDEMRSLRSDKEVIINPDSVQVMAYAENSKHPVYPLKDPNQNILLYMVRNHSQRLSWYDPHPCEWDAREAAENILSTE